MHVASDRLMGVAPRDPGSMIYFPTITIFYIIEDGVQELWRRITGNTASDAGASTPLWKRIVGYAWVFSGCVFACLGTTIHPYEYRRRKGRQFLSVLLKERACNVSLPLLSQARLFYTSSSAQKYEGCCSVLPVGR